MLETDGFDFVVIGFQRGTKKIKADIFLGIDKKNREEMNEILEEVYQTINSPAFKFRPNRKKRRKK